MTDDASPRGVGESVSRPPGIIRGACIMLMVVGFITLTFSLPVVFSPARARCDLARAWIKDANEDKKNWNNVDTGGQKPKDLACPDAIRLADQIPLKEKGTKTATVPGESALRLQNTIAVLMGAGQLVSGVILLRKLSRQARNLAIGVSAAGIILQALGILSLAAFVFVTYALAFSAASREIWPKEPRA